MRCFVSMELIIYRDSRVNSARVFSVLMPDKD
jgi:hypothetical protein